MRWTVGQSLIHGQGLFAKNWIPQGAVIGVCEGKKVRKDGPHVLWIDDRTGLRVHNEMRYINHSSEPNAVYYDDATVVALRDIAPNEEITHNYGFDHSDDEAQWN